MPATPDEPLTRACHEAVAFLKSRGVAFAPGLTDDEVEAIQGRFGFRFPPDLRAFLQTALPDQISARPGNDAFPNWRDEPPTRTRARLDWPFEGIASDIEHNAFWWKDWGPKPARLEEAVAVARRHVNAAPKLIPVFSHRYIAADPPAAGNPVMSVYQTDIIFYGADLWDYLRHEFNNEVEPWQHYSGMSDADYWAAHRRVRFWTNLVRRNSGLEPDEAADRP